MENFFDYFQLISLAVFVLVLVWRILPLAGGRGDPATATPGRRWSGLLLVAGLLFWMLEIVLASFHVPFRPFSDILSRPLLVSREAPLFGVAMILFGFELLFVALGDVGRAGRTEAGLMTRGVYGFSRNPLYLFLDLYFLGTFLINGTMVFLLFVAGVVAGLHYRILREEQALSKRYGPAYDAYRRTTGRYLTFKRPFTNR
jgi:protein-S-isoprenylcysteine O-methyltransferase Ste14